MKKFLLLLLGTLFITATIYAVENPPQNSDSKSIIEERLNLKPIAFTENQGQWDESVLYRANANGATIWFTTEGVYYQLTKKALKLEYLLDVIFYNENPQSPESKYDSDKYNYESMMINASFVGANPNLTISGEDLMEYKCNYFIGNDPDQWYTDVPNYKAVIYKDIYAGIDLKYYSNGTEIEYDLIVSPGADLAQIQIKYEGAEAVNINESGDLVVAAKWGKIIESIPLVYYDEGEDRTELRGDFVQISDNSVGFDISNQDYRYYVSVIDPIISFSTFLGGDEGAGAIEWFRDMAADEYGNTYLTGTTVATDFPTVNPYQSSNNGGWDVFITKFSPDGNIIYSTYLGGSDGEDGFGIAIDYLGNAFVTGTTHSDDFPLVNAYDSSRESWDAFIAKLSPAGNNLLYSTFLGGWYIDRGVHIAVDSNNYILVTGSTESDDFPLVDECQSVYGGTGDIFLTKFTPAGDALTYSTYLGGSKEDRPQSMIIGEDGSTYITGSTASSDFPTVAAYDDTFNGSGLGVTDAFVTKFAPFGCNIIFSTFLGGTGYDRGWDIIVTSNDNAIIVGSTASSDFPTVNPYDGIINGWDAFLVKFSATGSSLEFSTFIGGSDTEFGRGVAFDLSNNLYITGSTSSNDFPIVNAYDNSYNGYEDVFIVKMPSLANEIQFSTYLGGQHDDGTYYVSVAIDIESNIYVAGQTRSTDFPIVNGNAVLNGVRDIFLTKLYEYICEPVLCDIELGLFDDSYRLNDNSRALIDVGLYAVPDFVDIDNDGDCDLFIGEWFGEIWYYRNDGNATNHSYTFVTSSFESIDVGRSAAPSFADIDNDGDFDLFIGNNYTVGFGAGDMWFYENVGTPESPSFTLISSEYLPLVNTGISKPDFVDIDCDGDLDMFFGYEEEYPDGEYGLVFYRNDGNPFSPNWTLVTTGYNGLSGMNYTYTYYPDFVDVDCDGDFDMLLGKSNTYIIYYRNDGDATSPIWTYITNDFGSVSEHILGDYPVPQLFDINADGLYDLCVGIGVSSGPDDEEGIIQIFLGLLSGDVDGSGGVDISDAVHLIAYIFSGGPAPIPLSIGDVDCSGAVDISDVVYLINYIFDGGPPPGDPNGDGVPDC